MLTKFLISQRNVHTYKFRRPDDYRLSIYLVNKFLMYRSLTKRSNRIPIFPYVNIFINYCYLN